MILIVLIIATLLLFAVFLLHSVSGSAVKNQSQIKQKKKKSNTHARFRIRISEAQFPVPTSCASYIPIVT